MSENTSKSSPDGKALNRELIGEMLLKNFERLPDFEQKHFLYGSVYLGGNAALAGLISNSLYRRVLNVRQARFASALPMAVLPFITTCFLYGGVVSRPLLSGDLNCPTCCILRGGLVGLFGGTVYPIIMALPLNASLAAKYSTAPLPGKDTMLRFYMDLSRPVLKKMRFVMVLQVLFGSYLSYKHQGIYYNLAEITFGRPDEELLH